MHSKALNSVGYEGRLTVPLYSIKLAAEIRADLIFCSLFFWAFYSFRSRFSKINGDPEFHLHSLLRKLLFVPLTDVISIQFSQIPICCMETFVVF